MKIQTGYEPLAEVLQMALDQAQAGKGKDRHACDKPFLNQPMMTISRMTGTGGPIYQACKKGQESMRLPTDRAIDELLGAINYLAGAVLILKEQNPPTELRFGPNFPITADPRPLFRDTGMKLMDTASIMVGSEPPHQKLKACLHYSLATRGCSKYPNPVCLHCPDDTRKEESPA